MLCSCSPQEAALQAEKAEKEMHQKILRGTAELTKAANVQHEATHSLLSHRQRTLEDKRMLAEEKKVHTTPIGDYTSTAASLHQCPIKRSVYNPAKCVHCWIAYRH